MKLLSGPLSALDAQIAVTCLRAGVRELVTMDRDFARFPFLTVETEVPIRASVAAAGGVESFRCLIADRPTRYGARGGVESYAPPWRPYSASFR